MVFTRKSSNPRGVPGIPILRPIMADLAYVAATLVGLADFRLEGVAFRTVRRARFF
jgi:hypothetical protein